MSIYGIVSDATAKLLLLLDGKPAPTGVCRDRNLIWHDCKGCLKPIIRT
ncbi:MAG: hypothetical protein KME42_14775 [Tildeniella nuda ZEHNDER 1965/U140]|nr:hypothetical protein [Tildeniella nuda ZEHNDER 1965/U140]